MDIMYTAGCLVNVNLVHSFAGKYATMSEDILSRYFSILYYLFVLSSYIISYILL